MGVKVPEVYLPADRDNLEKWCVIACDQYTSDIGYWKQVDSYVGDAPSTLHMILPEVYLNTDRQAAIEQSAAEAMQRYLTDSSLQQLAPGFILVKRSFANKPQQRTGLVVLLDLELYDYRAGSTSLIRASEGTIEQRLPARVAIRRKAALELPHIMVLIDDKQRGVIEPLAARTGEFKQVYGSALAYNMGRIEGYLVPEAAAEPARQALSQLLDSLLAREGFDTPMLYAMGDGNHSFAAAKAYWDEIKPGLSELQREAHPARYCLCELVNIHDEGLEFEGIHRVVLNGGIDGIQLLLDGYADAGTQATLSDSARAGMQNIRYSADGQQGYINIANAPHSLEAGSIDIAINYLLKQAADAKVDYVHGSDEALALAQGSGNIALLMPAISKDELFETVERNGALPRKAFSMGEADEKRCYLECNRIRPS